MNLSGRQKSIYKEPRVAYTLGYKTQEEEPMIAVTPPMGWNSWNTFGKDIDEKLVFEIADAMVEKGYREAGYEYPVIDDCWS